MGDLQAPETAARVAALLDAWKQTHDCTATIIEF